MKVDYSSNLKFLLNQKNMSFRAQDDFAPDNLESTRVQDSFSSDPKIEMSAKRMVSSNAEMDQVDFSKPKKKGSFIKRAFANVWKFFATLNKMVAASAKGLFYGTTGALGVAAIGYLMHIPSAYQKLKTLKLEQLKNVKDLALVLNKKIKIPNKFQISLKSLKNVLAHPTKTIGTAGLVLSAVTGLGIFAINIIRGKMGANKRTADIDHQLNVGHRDK